MTRPAPSKHPSKPSARSRRIAESLTRWFKSAARDLPWRRTLDPYAIWVSEIMLQQTQVKTVIPYWERWMRELPSLAALAASPEPKLLKLWEGLGYYSRVRNMKRAAIAMQTDHGGQFPDSSDALLSLPGIGRYTAGAVLSIAFNQPAPVLDGNVVRVLSRLFALKGDPKEKQTRETLWSHAGDLVLAAVDTSHEAPPLPRLSAGSCSDLNQALMELGATVCVPDNPLCDACPLSGRCVAGRAGIAEQFPQKAARPKTTHRRFEAFIVERNGLFLVRQREERTVNARLWEFPNLETDSGGSSSRPERALFHVGPQFASVRHSITRYRIQLDAYLAELSGPDHPPGALWVSASTLDSLPFSAAHAKLRSLLAKRHSLPKDTLSA